MAVAHDTDTKSHTTGGSQGEPSFSWSHTGAASGVKGVLVLTWNFSSATNIVTGVTYGGPALTAVTGGSAADTLTEPGNVTSYFLGSSVPQGTQTVVVSRTNNSNIMWAVAISVLADGDTSYAGVLLEQENQALTEENIDDGSPGANSVRYLGLFSGTPDLVDIPAAANSTALQGIVLNAHPGQAYRETTAGQGARPVGAVAVSDDVAAVYLAVTELVAAAPILRVLSSPQRW